MMKKLFALGIITVILCGCGAKKEEAPPPPAPDEVAEAENEIPEEGAELPQVSESVVTDENFDQLAMPEKGDTVAIMKTNMGDIKIKFFAEDAPKAVENFTTHAKNGYYDGITFHRIINDFMIQGGDPKGTGRGGESIWGEDFEDEFTARLHNYRGALSMANAGPGTNGSQFFIVQAGPGAQGLVEDVKYLSEYEGPMYMDNRTGEIISGAQRFTQKAVDIYDKVGGTPYLDGGWPNQEGILKGHTVFGQVYEGMDIVDTIAAVEVDANGKPVEPVVIEKIEVTQY